MKSNAVDLKTASKPDTSIWLLTFQQALKARDVELMGLQNETEQLKSAAVHLEEKLLSAGESHKAQIGKLKDILRETDVELMDLQNKNKHIKSTKLLAAETSRHKQAEAATRSAELTRQLKEVSCLLHLHSAHISTGSIPRTYNERNLPALFSWTAGYRARRISSTITGGLNYLAPVPWFDWLHQDYDILDVQAQEHETTNENLRRMNHTLKESALQAEIQGEEREATIENLQRTNMNMMGLSIPFQELKQAADEERRASEEKLTSALRANAMLQTICALCPYSSLHNAHYQLVKERGAGALEPSVNQTGIPAPAFPQAQSAAGQFESHPDRHYEHRVGAYPSQPSVQSQSGANDRLSSDADQAPGLSDRVLCCKFMNRLPSPNRSIRYDALKPIQAISRGKSLDGLKTERQPVHFPMRSFFTNAPCTHALVFAPTHEYWPPADKWDTFSHTGKFCGLTFDLFVNRGASVYYAGIYTMLSLTGEAPGFDIPADVSPAAIHHAARLGNRKMPDCFPGGKMKVKWYGLQFLGFDLRLYEQLRRRYLAATVDNHGMKMKASTAYLSAGGGSAKMQKTQ
ncbi:hypothetical protein C8J57DRAFT_1229786 [Mycena rebaudengoi]|nr:hypothetical protein C8J57DRAFT_1229786 [Mycena rebaudengoi]